MKHKIPRNKGGDALFSGIYDFYGEVKKIVRGQI